MSTPREEILARIRAARSVAPFSPPAPVREYRTRDDRSLPELLDLLAERLIDYQATVRRGPDAAELIGAALSARGPADLVVPAGVPAEWRRGIPSAVQQVADEPPLSAGALDEIGGVLTGCRVAIAETGTLVLDAGADQGRRMLSLVPDYCLAVVRPDQVVAGVPGALGRLDPARPLTWVSGPSATSDIELSRVEGVHGPRTLEVLLLG
jgi:L-lactate dehydrogenase complex protein LldG